MFSKILIKLIDEAILPAILLVGTRVFSIYLIARYAGINFIFSNKGFIYENFEDYVFVNSYSSLMMVGLLGLGLAFILMKSLAFHQTHIAPNLTTKLFSLKLSSLIQTTFDLYSQGAVWLSYLYLMSASALIMALFGLMYFWVFWVSLAIALISTVLFIIDLEKEIGDKTSHSDTYEEVVVKFGELD